ncbi:MAG: RIP metalloprotease RseP [Rhizomicrobium sp.]
MIQPFYELGAWVLHNVLPFVLIITPVIFFHELGHFSVARAFGVRIETFSIGVGPAIASWLDGKGTRWKISWIPLGGYVRFFGDLDAASTPDREGAERMTAAERAVAFQFKPLYQRALIVAAGPAANFVLAIVILTAFVAFFGAVVAPPIVSEVVPGSAAQAAGFRKGDVIVDINGRHIDSFDNVTEIVALRPGEPLNVTVERLGNPIVLHVTPRLTTVKDELGEIEKVGRLGIGAQPRVVHYGLFGAFQEACHRVWMIVQSTLDLLYRLFTSPTAASQLHGPLGIAKLSAQVAAVSYLWLINLAAVISVSIGLVNLFPIPLLDGGHLLYYGCEAVLGHPLGARAQDAGFRLGLAVMLGLMLLATWNDLVRLNLF